MHAGRMGKGGGTEGTHMVGGARWENLTHTLLRLLLLVHSLLCLSLHCLQRQVESSLPPCVSR